MDRTHDRVLVFGGTTEGRAICRFLRNHGMTYILSVATEYGREAVDMDETEISVKRMDQSEMVRFYQKERISLIIDATHPYAKVVSANIAKSCEIAGVELLRIVRPLSANEDTLVLDSHQEAARYLNCREGNVFLSIGSKDIGAYSAIEKFQDRVYARILPMAESIAQCLAAGMKSAHLICMQGPFSREMNKACFQMTGAEFLVTKDSGDYGGVADKLEAAGELGIQTIVIGRQGAERGYTLDQFYGYMKDKYCIQEQKFPVFISLYQKEVVVVGGGNIAVRRIQKLLPFAPNITVISPKLHQDLDILYQEKKISWKKRKYQPGDLSGCEMVLAAADQREVNRAVALEADEKNILSSIADDRQAGSFWFPAVVTKDDLIYGIVSAEGNHAKVKDAAQQIKNLGSGDHIGQKN